MVKTLKIFFSRIKKAFKLNVGRQSIGDTSSTKFVKMIVGGWPLTILRQDQIYAPIHLYGENVEKSFSQIILKTNGWNLQCMIKVVKHFSYNQHFVPWGYLSLPWAIYMYKIV